MCNNLFLSSNSVRLSTSLVAPLFPPCIEKIFLRKCGEADNKLGYVHFRGERYNYKDAFVVLIAIHT